MNPEYHDALGRPLKEGDIVFYPTSQSSSIYINYAIIDSIEPKPKADYGQSDRPHWNQAFKLKVKKLDQDTKYPDLFRPQKQWVNSNWVPGRLADTKLTPVNRVERVFLVENGEVDDR